MLSTFSLPAGVNYELLHSTEFWMVSDCQAVAYRSLYEQRVLTSLLT